MLHLMRRSRPKIYSAARELSEFMSGAAQAHVKAMLRLTGFCVGTSERGLLIEPVAVRDGNRDGAVTIYGSPDSTYANDSETRRSVEGYVIFMERATVKMRSAGARTVALSVMEAELYLANKCSLELMYVTCVIE